MSLSVTISLKNKDNQQIAELNHALAALNLDKRVEFLEAGHQTDWLDEINTHPGSPQAHLKPADRDLTLEELQSYFPGDVIGEARFDIGHSRTSEGDMQKILSFIGDHESKISSVRNMIDLLDRSGVGHLFQSLSYLESVFPDVTYEYPDAMKQLTIEGIGSGLSHYSPGSDLYTTAYARVDMPKFLKSPKDKIDPGYNSIAKDSKGQAVIGLPLLKMDGSEADQVVAFYDRLWDLGVRESFHSFILQHYAHFIEVKHPSFNSEDEAKRVYDAIVSHLGVEFVDANGEVDLSRIPDNVLKQNLSKTIDILASYDAGLGPR